jgi:hypothetical protein
MNLRPIAPTLVAAFIVVTLTALPHPDAPDSRCFATATVPEAELDGHRMSILLILKMQHLGPTTALL